MKSKRLLACLTLVVLLAASLPLSALAETYATVISFDVLHLRSGPGSDYAILGKYRRGTKVEVLSTQYTGQEDWLYVQAVPVLLYQDRVLQYDLPEQHKLLPEQQQFVAWNGFPLCQIRNRTGKLPEGCVLQFKAAGPAERRNGRPGSFRRQRMVQGPV